MVPAEMNDKTVDKYLKPPYNLEKVELSWKVLYFIFKHIELNGGELL